MLNEYELEKYLYRYAVRMDDFVTFVLTTTASRVEANDHIKSIDKLSSLNEAFKTSHDRNEIKKAYDNLKKEQVKALKDDLWAIAALTFVELKPLYDYNVGTLKSNPELSAEVTKQINKATAELHTLMNTPVFVLDGKTTSPENAYNVIVNDAIQNKPLKGSVKSMRNALNRLYDAPFKFVTNLSDSKHKAIVDANKTLRMNVLSNIKNVIETINETVKKQVKGDGVELSAHMFPAPDHAPAQGHQFSNEEFEKMQRGQDFVDVQGNKYTGFPRQIGQWNCRHYVKPIKIGKTKPEHTDKELKKILDDNEKGFTTSDGKHYTLYECTQLQREFERNIREHKERYIVASELKDKVKMAEHRGKVGELTRQYKLFSNLCGIPAKLERIRVKNY